MSASCIACYESAMPAAPALHLIAVFAMQADPANFPMAINRGDHAPEAHKAPVVQCWPILSPLAIGSRPCTRSTQNHTTRAGVHIFLLIVSATFNGLTSRLAVHNIFLGVIH
eukprot:1140807-Pelagomonas_calceolata.AAC.3